MHFSKLFLAVLPALAMAQDDEETTTQTSTAVVTKTYFLSQVHTITATGFSTEIETTVTSIEVLSESTSIVPAQNTTTYEPTPGSTVASTVSSLVSESTGASSEPSQVPENAGSALEAGKLALAGVAGMVVVALL